MAVIGAGRMGSAMVGTLRRSGFPVSVWNRSADKAHAAADAVDATVATSVRDAVAAADVVITSLADDKAVEAVYLGDEGVAASVGPDHVVVETSTIEPATQRTVGAAVEASGAAFLDAPVSGSVTTVEAGALTIMAGGDEESIERARPVLDALASRIVHVGGRGTGAATKLAVNALVHGLNVALAESLVLAERAGVDRSTAYEVFASGAGAAPFVLYKRDAYEHPDKAPVAFSLDLTAKDLVLINRLGEQVGAPMRQATASLAIVKDAIDAGFGDRDLSALAVHMRGEGT